MSAELDYYIELRGVYDGWSIAVWRDGTMTNRWPPDDRRHKPTQEHIEKLQAQKSTKDSLANIMGGRW